MTTAELVVALRELADAVEREQPQGGRPRVDLWVHAIEDRESLAKWAGLLANPRVNGTSNTVRGDIEGVDCTLFYKTGLLSPTERVEVVLRETNPDLAGLLAEFAKEGASA